MFTAENLTFISVLVAIVGVVATFLAPQISRTARVSFQITDVFEIRRATPTSTLSIVVQHNGEVVEEQVFIIRCTIRNTGNVDLVRTHFADPIEVVLPQTIEILSVEVFAAEGIKPQLSTEHHRALVSWSLLKTREDIEISLTAKSSQPTTEDEVSKSVRDIVRLVNVKVGAGFWAARPNLRNSLVGGIVGLVLMGALLLTVLLVRDNDMLIVRSPAGVAQAMFLPGSSRSQLCVVQQLPVLIGDCEAITREESIRLLPLATRGGGFTGAPPVVIGLMSFIILACAAIGAMLGQIFGSLSRVRRIVSRSARAR